DTKEKAEQELAKRQADTHRHRPSAHHLASAPDLASASAPDPASASAMTADDNGAEPEAEADAAFFDSLDALLAQGKGNIDVEDNLEDFFDGDDECEVQHTDEDIHGFEPYLPTNETTEQRIRNDAEAAPTNALAPEVPTSDALNNGYIRVVHTNGIHHLAMVTCQCQGEHRIPLDLVASNLLPTSFTRIRTRFTVQVLDHFRLCNLELKASAYQ